MGTTVTPTASPTREAESCEFFDVSKFKVKGAEQIKNRMAVDDPCECFSHCEMMLDDLEIDQAVVWSLKRSDSGKDLCTCFIMKKKVSRVIGKKVKKNGESSMVASHLGKKVIKMA